MNKDPHFVCPLTKISNYIFLDGQQLKEMFFKNVNSYINTTCILGPCLAVTDDLGASVCAFQSKIKTANNSAFQVEHILLHLL